MKALYLILPLIFCACTSGKTSTVYVGDTPFPNATDIIISPNEEEISFRDSEGTLHKIKDTAWSLVEEPD